MDATAQAATPPDGPDSPPSPLQAQADAYRFRLVGTLRSLAAVSAGAALILEASGPTAEVVALLQTLDRLQAQAGADVTCLGGVIGSAGSA